MTIFRNGAEVLHELGITDPRDIDVEAIAFYCGATVQYSLLKGCAAHIIGFGDRAVITIDETSPHGRKRFSVGHELGHWMWHRGQALACGERDIRKPWSAVDKEAIANGFAADLLMPAFLFGPRCKDRPISFATVDALMDAFSVSKSACAIRLVEFGSWDAMVLCSSAQGIEWFHGSQRVHRVLWPHKQLSRDSYAWDILKGGSGSRHSSKVTADDWIDHERAKDYEILEHSVSYGDAVLTLLWWKDDSMIEDLVG